MRIGHRPRPADSVLHQAPGGRARHAGEVVGQDVIVVAVGLVGVVAGEEEPSGAGLSTDGLRGGVA
ncbi:hypothetical protein AB852_13900 [Streptomyces uncialis]|uniref:Uncharacterized protein n=1 Tax=Streptomyces uncialis TaxID=1048205 RepID=A0A1Q4V7K9_9ACTN|nr:hypothetical protein AB852_13900 [Streptomyces uncialis]